jgi:hypothetical protein
MLREIFEGRAVMLHLWDADESPHRSGDFFGGWDRTDETKNLKNYMR